MIHCINQLGIDIIPRSSIRWLRVHNICQMFTMCLKSRKRATKNENPCILVFGRFFLPEEFEGLSPAIANPAPEDVAVVVVVVVVVVAGVEGLGCECHEA